jgi:hypothetical protein
MLLDRRAQESDEQAHAEEREVEEVKEEEQKNTSSAA